MTIVEMMVASVLLLVLMGAALSTVAVTIVESRQTRATDIASAMATAEIEEYRTFTFDAIAMDANDASIPNTHNGLPVHKSSDCGTCPVHVETVSDASGDFTITRWVLEVDDDEDGTGASDADAETVDYKQLVVEVSWAHARGGDTTITTNVNRDGTQPFTAPQGVAFEIIDEDGERIEDTGDEFPLTVTMDSEDYTDTAAEGYGTVLSVPAGSGFCKVSAPSILWESLSGSDPHTQACSVTEDAVTSVTSAWRFVPCNEDLGAGTSVVTVEDGGSGVVGATVQVTQTFVPNDTFSTTTDADGEATFSSLPSGLYNVTVTDAVLGTTSGELCARPDSEGGGATTVNYTDPETASPSPSPSPSSTVSPSPSPSATAGTCTPTPDSTDEFEFKWKVENLTGSDHSFRMRIVALDGGTEYLEGPKTIEDTKDHEFKRKVDFKYDCFDAYIECEQAPGTWSTVFLEDDLQAIKPTDTDKKDRKIHEFNGDPTDKDEAKSC